ncbi:hypothetical protein [uncultured Massilia sp.]|uniref:hypothetical protein n=1 Tax=uncultured Massilia sp. TaxID=169973 RepID=UPI00258E9077|nr:hypothetical protein [uncultured Massilia sp.]
MMTSTPVTPQQQTDGRTVREVVECNQELVNEVWCRRIFRQILQSLELQYAMQMPHRPIDPDTVLVLDSGDPILLPASGQNDPGAEAQDLHALAAVVHYAITRETPPRAPLRGRALPDDYSDTFLTAVDRCLAPDPAERPRTIEELRNLLGIVLLGPAVPAAPPQQATVHHAVREAQAASLDDSAGSLDRDRMRRWLLLVAAATVLLCAAGALVALLHQADARDALTLSLPEPAPTPPVAAAPQGMPADTVILTDDNATPAPPLVQAPQAEATPAAASQPTPPRAAPAAVAGASYKLVIKPWGLVQVDGVDHGASPPLKRLNLAPGEHTIRITNPDFPEHTVVVNAARGDASTIELDFSEEAAE